MERPEHPQLSRESRQKTLKIAIIGGGPGGLGVALELARLPFVEWTLYEKKPEIGDTGGGIALQPHTWRLLEHNGASQYIGAQDMFRAVDGQREQRRNGRTGKLIDQQYNLDDIHGNHQTCRLLRPKLQAALLEGADHTRIHVNKKLATISCVSNKIRILFEDGHIDVVDLLVGADGIRSIVRKWGFPGHEPCYKGQLVFRTVVRKSEVSRIPGMAQAWCPTFWKNVSGFYVFTCPLGNDDFEVTVRMRPPVEGTQAEPASWGRRFDLTAILDKCGDFCSPVREVLRLAAAANETREFALFAGPRLPRVVANGNVALVGDAAHPQSGNFGSGAGFALEDGYTLARSLEWAWLTNGKGLGDALELFDSVRSSYYKRLYGVLDKLAAVKAAIPAGLTIDQEIEERVKAVSENTERWMYYYNIGKEVNEAIQAASRATVSQPQPISHSLF